MTQPAIIDALYSVPHRGPVAEISDCIPFFENLSSRMKSSGIAGAVLVHGNCSQCRQQWHCPDRKTHELAAIVSRNPKQLRGLAGYDSLRIGESLRWMDDPISKGELAGAYIQAECCVAGLDAPRMYPLYGLCARLRVPVVVDFTSQDRWVYQRPQLEVVAGDFPELDFVLATPPQSGSASILRLMMRYARLSFLLGPQELQQDSTLSEYLESQGRERALFRAAPEDWAQAAHSARAVPLSPAARRAYLCENAARIFGFDFEAKAA